jgi:hypothetical protein
MMPGAQARQQGRRAELDEGEHSLPAKELEAPLPLHGSREKARQELPGQRPALMELGADAGEEGSGRGAEE